MLNLTFTDIYITDYQCITEKNASTASIDVSFKITFLSLSSK